ncbi:hypothetical protein HPGCJGGD_4254 [Methylobacterium haplocladii]|nr:hypothetical protein HPGCJGGD_4254 [Methylobacterium haplocladii]
MRAVDVLEDLRDRHHQPRGRGALGGERPEIHRHRLHVVEQGVDRREVRAALRGVGGLAFEVDHPAHGVVDLAGVEPEMWQGVREAVRRDAGAQHRDGAPVGIRIGRADRRGEAGEQRAGIDLRALPFDDQRQGEAVHGFKRRLGAEQRGAGELTLDRVESARRQVPRHAGRRHVGQVAQDALELHPLRDQPVAERVPPADIGAPVGVAADPGGDGEGLRDGLGPAVGPALAGRVEERAVEDVERTATVIGRDAGLLELVVEADLRIGPGRERGSLLDERGSGGRVRRRGGRGDRGGDGLRHAEGRVRREHRREGGAADEIAKRLQVALAPGDPCHQSPGEIRLHAVGCVVPEPDIGAQPPGPLVEGVAPEACEQRVEIVLADLLAVEPPGDRQRHREHGIAKGILGRLGARLRNQFEQRDLQVLRSGRDRARGGAIVGHRGHRVFAEKEGIRGAVVEGHRKTFRRRRCRARHGRGVLIVGRATQGPFLGGPSCRRRAHVPGATGSEVE